MATESSRNVEICQKTTSNLHTYRSMPTYIPGHSLGRGEKVVHEMKMEKQLWVFVNIKYGKFWSVLPGHFIKQKTSYFWRVIYLRLKKDFVQTNELNLYFYFLPFWYSFAWYTLPKLFFRTYKHYLQKFHFPKKKLRLQFKQKKTLP